ncbi:putative CID domain, mRNA splicing factor Cwf21 domain-containing protein [Helianthus debilis subsp. tardiflorus]
MLLLHGFVIAKHKNASAYRTKFEANLPDILESFNDLYRTVIGRITVEALKVILTHLDMNGPIGLCLLSHGLNQFSPVLMSKLSLVYQERVLKVLQVWADWFLFSDAYVNGLHSTFLRSDNSGVVAFHSISTETEDKTNYDETGDVGKANPDAALAIGKSAATKELMSLPLAELERRCRHNGLSLVGEAVETTHILTSSDSGLSEEKRQKLGQVEAALIDYRESLEERGMEKEEIEKKVAVHQKQLQYKYGLANASEDTSNKSKLPIVL